MGRMGLAEKHTTLSRATATRARWRGRDAVFGAGAFDVGSVLPPVFASRFTAFPMVYT
jgi:hypothetical protein